MNGELCPSVNFVDLKFTFSSKSLERSQATLSVLVFSEAMYYKTLKNNIYQGREDKLQVESYKVDQEGKMTIVFNKDVDFDMKTYHLLQQ